MMRRLRFPSWMKIHRVKGAIAVLLLLTGSLGNSFLFAQTIKVVTINIWSGLDYRGTLVMGTYEADSIRARRLELLAELLETEQPDLIALQECNPVGSVASYLGNRLGYDYIAQRANGGIKIGFIGIPWNLNEGLVLLAKKNLHLRKVDVVDLSRTFGAFGNVLSLHGSDQNIALAASVTIGGRNFLAVNTHLTSDIPLDPATRHHLQSLFEQKNIPPDRQQEILEEAAEGNARRTEELTRLATICKDRWSDYPVLVLGDFNVPPDQPSLRIMEKEFFDAAEAGGLGNEPTWDPLHNPNTRYSRIVNDSSNVIELLHAWYDGVPRRIDYILLNRHFRPQDVRTVRRIGDKPTDGLFLSDHYGVEAEIDVGQAIASATLIPETIPQPPSTLDVLPILTYDTDVGFGYGGKAFFLNYLGLSESFDVVVFNSTKGERWYRFVYSIPDFELRQGKTYPFSLDLIVDYDKYLKNNFFGIGSGSRAVDRETYTKEPLDIQIVGSRGFNRGMVGQVGIRYRMVNNKEYDPDGLFATTLPAVNQGTSSGVTVFTSFRLDSRDSFVNPSEGSVLQCDLEAGSSKILGDYNLVSFTLALQNYQILFYPKTVLASRVVVRTIGGSGLPVQVYPSLGGTGTLRGFPQDRFLDRSALLTNMELRFPLYWRFAGVAFYDAGTLAPSVGQLPIWKGWNVSPGIGLRFLMDTFVVRADLGFSREGTGFYFNFGHLF